MEVSQSSHFCLALACELTCISCVCYVDAMTNESEK